MTDCDEMRRIAHEAIAANARGDLTGLKAATLAIESTADLEWIAAQISALSGVLVRDLAGALDMPVDEVLAELRRADPKLSE